MQKSCLGLVLPDIKRWQKKKHLERWILFASTPQSTSFGILCYSSRSQRSETAWDLTLKQSWDETFLHVWSLNWTQISRLQTDESRRKQGISGMDAVLVQKMNDSVLMRSGTEALLGVWSNGTSLIMQSDLLMKVWPGITSRLPADSAVMNIWSYAKPVKHTETAKSLVMSSWWIFWT